MACAAGVSATTSGLLLPVSNGECQTKRFSQTDYTAVVYIDIHTLACGFSSLLLCVCMCIVALVSWHVVHAWMIEVHVSLLRSIMGGY